MSRRCQLTGVDNMSGNNVSHSNRKTKRKFKINIKKISCWSSLEKKEYKLRIGARVLKTIDKLGGFDNYILSLRPSQMTEFAYFLKKRLTKIQDSGRSMKEDILGQSLDSTN